MKYFLGIFIFALFGYFVYKQVKSIILDIRNRVSKRKSSETPEQKDVSAAEENSEKEV